MALTALRAYLWALVIIRSSRAMPTVTELPAIPESMTEFIEHTPATERVPWMTSIALILDPPEPVFLLLDTLSPSPPVLMITITPPPVTVTVTAPPTTVTDTITVTSAPVSNGPPTASATSAPLDRQWTMPTQISDLSSFNISSFPGARRNIKIVTGIPAAASPTASLAMDAFSPLPWDNSSSVLQVIYPANSVNPGRKPQGGAEFYATPISLEQATSVTLQYSVFFPANFDWVLAGKLPGLYGGHSGCSGGNDALNCFSTRLMWRTGGFGELYLYAPKFKQTEALCSDPQSVCDTEYGLSVGRGSFRWVAGSWTTVQQTVTLNTPGKQDGGFTLRVNGKLAINRSDVFYRHATPTKTTGSLNNPTRTATRAPASTSIGDDLGDILGPILDDLLGRSPMKRHDFFLSVDVEYAKQFEIQVFPHPPTTGIGQRTTTVVSPQATPTVTVTIQEASTVTATSTSSENEASPVMLMVEAQKRNQVVGFIGIFFSTFFGGHDDRYATPKDQYVWFKDFALTNNAQ